jgi:small subunit ribosomal protein S5|tara:strand:- start:817 stop:1590 length:774 start_codon:yes stop_codon:yes gene_type:complete
MTEGKSNVDGGKKPKGDRTRAVRGTFDKESWKPKTSLGMKVKTGKIDDIDYILDNKLKILEHEIVDILMPNLTTDLLLVGQSKGKFGGGQRRVFRQTQKKTREGNKPKFGTFAIVGNSDGYVGIGYGKSKETVPAREKATRNAKQNIIQVLRGCGSWQCGCKQPHSVPFAVEGKYGSVKIKLIPAPRGTGLCIEGECGKILKIAGITDVWSHTSGQTRTKTNLIYACFDALKKLMEIKLQQANDENLGVVEGPVSVQ